MIYYNNNTINKLMYDEADVNKMLYNSNVCYPYIKGESGGGDTGQTPCYAVTSAISQYSDTTFDDVYDTTQDKWYKKNNLSQYEEYGIYGSGRTNTTYYEGKLTIDNGYEYIYSGNSWVNLGEVSGSTTQTVWYDPPSSGSDNANFNIGHYWGENYKMIYTLYLQGSYSGDKGSFWQHDNKSPLEFNFYNNGYYFDLHNPTSTSSPSVNTTDNDFRILKQSVFSNYESGQVMNFTLTYGSVKVELEESGTVIDSTGSTRTGYSWYNGLYEPSITLNNTAQTCHVSRIQVYNASDVLVNDLKFVKNNGVTGSQEISMVDTVLNAVYNNTNENTPCYHVVEERGSSVYPEYYDEIADPPTSVTFATMADALAYQCPYVGLRATIAGDNYVFNSNYEWEEIPSRLPQGYTELTYAQTPNKKTLGGSETFFVPIDLEPTYNYIFSFTPLSWEDSYYSPLVGGVDSDSTNKYSSYGIYKLDNGWGNMSRRFEGSFYNYNIGTRSAGALTGGWRVYTDVKATIKTHLVNYAKGNGVALTVENEGYETVNLTSTTINNSSYTVVDGIYNLQLFTSYGNDVKTPYLKFHELSVKTNNNQYIYQYVPAKRDSDDKVGLFDIINEQFYYPSTFNLTAGNPV